LRRNDAKGFSPCYRNNRIIGTKGGAAEIMA
jgi:hypothetical protein